MREFVTVHLSEQHPGVGTLLLSRPPTNALTRQTYREVASAATELGQRDDVAVVILFGGHEIFSAGDDMPDLRTLTPGEADARARLCHDAVAALAAIPKPTVAAITGYALGGGLTLALAADWRISGDNVKLGATEILAGLIPDAGGMLRLAGAVGVSKAKELVFSGRFVDAREAVTLGLVDEMVAPDAVYEAAVRWAARFVDAAPGALAAAKSVLDGGADGSGAGQLDAQRRRYVETFAASQAFPDRRFVGYHDGR